MTACLAMRPSIVKVIKLISSSDSADDDSGHFILGKMVTESQIALTAFKVSHGLCAN